MKNRNFGGSQQQPLSDESLTQGTALSVMTLTEPRFQDLNHTSRFFVDYCELSFCPDSGATC